jgi:hypothetical protein
MAYLSLGFRSVVAVLTAVGCVPTLLSWKHPTWCAPAALAVLLILVLVVVVLDVRSTLAGRPDRYRTDAEIRAFMFKWINSEGLVTIYSRDMSWAPQEQRIMDLLERKARNNELTICVPAKVPLTDRLAALGAEVHTYEKLGYQPRSRFTVIRTGRQDACVAIGRSLGEDHVIETFSAGEHPAYGLAEDLIAMTTRLSASA